MQTDVLIIGCGIAGVTAALRLAADRQRQITIVTRAEDPIDSSSSHAQGGIVGRGQDDTFALLVDDVIRAGAGLSYSPAVEILAEEGPRLLDDILVSLAGVDFDRNASGEYYFTQEAAHSKRRILHVGDTTGHAIMTALLRKVIDQPNITLLTGHVSVDLLTFPHHALDPLAIYESPKCHGAYVFNRKIQKVIPILAMHTVLATGGLGQIFLNTSNPPGVRGDGLSMAFRAGARVINAEYVQFHPTTLHLPGPTKFLISEAVRGEGGVLMTPDGNQFMAHYSPEWKDLAPRDVVALATQQPIPVVPAAHYFCGGVHVDLWGRSSLPGLYAIGEISCSGVHGANRLASTSLLEGVVWGDRAARDIQRHPDLSPISEKEVPTWDDTGLIYKADPALIQGDMQTIRNLMWHYVGLVRSEHKLNRAIRELRHLWLEIEDFYRKTRLSDGLIGLRNSIQAALLVASAARRNTTSRGCHYREDDFTGGIPLPIGHYPPDLNESLK
jgi:L-aspartate oxidase